MKSLYVIVHEEEVRIETQWVASSVKAYREIERIKRYEDFRNVDGEDPTVIPSDLPKPDECKIRVCGSSIAVCIPQQISALEKAGYDVELYRPASIF